MGFLGTINNLKVLCKYAPYRNVEHHGLFVASNTTLQHDFPPYLMGGKNYPLFTWIIGRRATYCFGTLAQHDTQTWSICWKMLLALKKKLSKNFLPKLVYMCLLCLVLLPIVVCYIICYNCKVKLTLIN